MMKTWVIKFKKDGKTVVKQFKSVSQKSADMLVVNFNIITGPTEVKSKSKAKRG